MAPSMTPSDALEYLVQLSTDVRAAVVLAEGDPARPLLAGREDLAAAARELLASTDAPEIEVSTAAGVVFAARSAAHAVVVACGAFALSGLQRHDLRTVLADLSA